MLNYLIILYAIFSGFQILLSIMEINFVKKSLKNKALILSEEDYKEAGLIKIENEKFNLAKILFDFIFFVIWVNFGIKFLSNLNLVNGIFGEVLLLLSFFVIQGILSLPFDYYQVFVKDKKQGFANITFKVFVLDKIKSLFVLFIFGSIFSYLILLCINYLGNSWWIWGFVLSFSFIILANAIYPTLIAPIFNKLSPLSDENLRLSIENLLSECGFKSNGVFVVDASKRDKRLNAYFGGLGNSKRVVLFDTLIDKLNKDEILAVLGHELGHFKHNDMLKNIALSSILLFLMFFVFGNLPLSFYSDLGNNSGAGILISMILVSPLLSIIFQPIVSFFSRKHEFAADKFASKTRNSKDMISALLKLGKENKSFPVSYPLYSAVYHSHPSLYERIKELSH